MNLRRLVVVSSLLSVPFAVGCSNLTDLGQQCFLVRKNPDGGSPIRLKESEIKAGRDFVAFGATECEDFVCVRDPAFRAELDGGAQNPNDDATGYCSRQCVEGTACPTSQDSDPSKRMTCRTVLLDDVTLQTLRTNDPEKFQRYFGSATSSFFCARGTVLDAGI